MYIFEFEINALPKTPNSLLGSHWRMRSQHSLKWRKLVAEVLVQARAIPEEPLSKAAITLIRCSAREPDFDGLTGSFKAVLDALVRMGVIVDDRPSVIGVPSYGWEYAKKGKIKVRIEEQPKD